MLIKLDDLNKLSEQARNSNRLRMNFNLHDSPNEIVQRLFNAIEPESVIPIARHPNSNETIILVQGKLRIQIFNEKKEIVEDVILDIKNGNIGYHITKGTWHKVFSLEINTILFETREGPYVPIENENILVLC